jgi:hypothetical protein
MPWRAEDEQVLYDIRHLIRLEKQDPVDCELGVILTKMRHPMDVDEYPWLKAGVVEIDGWGWLPLTAE